MNPWECPRCHKVNAPFASQCTCSAPVASPLVKQGEKPKQPGNWPIGIPQLDCHSQ